MKKILVIDDHPVVRKGIARIIEETADMTVTGEACNADQVREMVAETQCDAIILDISLPGKNGITVLKELRSEYPGIPVLILSMYPEDQYAFTTLKAGASGYLTKASVADELIAALKRVLRGGIYVTSTLGEKMALNLKSNDIESRDAILSGRELEVLRFIGIGNTVNQIAEKLHLSPKTVSTYRTRILQKLRLKTTAELIRYAVINEIAE